MNYKFNDEKLYFEDKKFELDKINYFMCSPSKIRHWSYAIFLSYGEKIYELPNTQNRDINITIDCLTNLINDVNRHLVKLNKNEMTIVDNISAFNFYNLRNYDITMRKIELDFGDNQNVVIENKSKIRKIIKSNIKVEGI